MVVRLRWRVLKLSSLVNVDSSLLALLIIFSEESHKFVCGFLPKASLLSTHKCWSRMGIDGTLIWKSIDQETLRFLKKNVTHSAETFFWWIYKLTLSFIEVSPLFNWIEKATVDVTEYDSPGYIGYWITSYRCSLFCEYNDSTFVFPMCN